MSAKNDGSSETSRNPDALVVLCHSAEQPWHSDGANCDYGKRRVGPARGNHPSAAVKPSFETASNPDRILLDLPDTNSNDRVKSVAVNAVGVRRVRTGLHSTSPLVTRVVLDLDQAHPYTVKTEGNRIVITISAVENAHETSHGAPVAATSGNLIGIFHRRRETPTPPAEESSADFPAPVPPATTGGPAFEPPANNSAGAGLPQPQALNPILQQKRHASPAPQQPAAQSALEPNQIASAAKPESVAAAPATRQSRPKRERPPRPL